MTSVIDWDGAKEQCGDDEEFLRELLGDFREETNTQISVIDKALQTPTDNSFHRIMRAAHGIKGAASNLMCQELRAAALNLEQAADAANEDSTAVGTVQERFADLKRAFENYQSFLRSIGV